MHIEPFGTICVWFIAEFVYDMNLQLTNEESVLHYNIIYIYVNHLSCWKKANKKELMQILFANTNKQM